MSRRWSRRRRGPRRHRGPIFRLLLVATSALPPVATGCGSEPAAPPAETGEIVTDFEGAALEAWAFGEEESFDLDLAPSPAGAARWYSFRLLGRKDRITTFRVIDAQAAAWESAWSYDRPVVSTDGGRSWTRIFNTAYSGFFFRFGYTPTSDDEWIAWAPAYDFSRWTARVEELRGHPLVVADAVVGQSREGRPVHHLVITDPEPTDGTRPGVWIVARQHPAETPGSWMLEGFLEWLLGGTAEARHLRRAVEVHVVPFLNPDGVVNGHYRVNGAGLDLNRVWDAPDPETAPTVAAARDLLGEWVDAGGELRLFVDLHGAPGSRKNFMYYNEDDDGGVADARALIDALADVTPLFWARGSEPFPGGTGIAQIWVERTFGAPAVTLEASMQDVTHGPHAGEYMEVADYRTLGEGLGLAIARWIDGGGPAR